MQSCCRLHQQDRIPAHGCEDRFQGEGCGEDEVEFCFQFADFGADLEQAEPDGIELGGGEVGARERLFPQGVQDVRPLLRAILWSLMKFSIRPRPQ